MRLVKGVIAATLFWVAWCNTFGAVVAVPEITLAFASSAIGLIVCALLILLDRRMKG